MSFTTSPGEQAVDGFGPMNPQDLTIYVNGVPFNTIDTTDALTDVLVERTISGASTVTLQMTDPQRKILNSGLFSYGDSLTLDNLQFTLVQFAKSSDQLQLVFEASGVAALRLQTGNTVTTTTSNITSFAQGLVLAVPGLSFVGDPNPVNPAIAVGRGTTTDPTDNPEDSWTCLQRLATTAGWRCWENNNTVYFGSDPFWVSYFGVGGTIQEWIGGVQNIDFDFDIGKPFGNLTVTAMTELWRYPPGTILNTAQLGPASSVAFMQDPHVPTYPNTWMVSDMQRDLYNPQATITCTVPMQPYDMINVGGGASQLQAI